ncbi:MAG TPA: hypothetical protein DCP90_06605 [Clostridiales bacterium]|nr:MAG: hypothetical protein A2Y22_00670 [Clostridiales bacterium GWD2_32_59]HAN10264.1 hypothetical protein [Clostridiales bacterium]
MKKILSKLISFKTLSNNKNEIEKCIEYIKSYMVDTNKNIQEYDYNGVKSLVISNSEGKAFDVIFVVHIDVVPASDELFVLREVGDRLYGRGSFDMKGAVTVTLKLMKNLETDKKVALFLTSDEEMGGFNGTKKLLEDEGYRAKVAIVPDGGKDFELMTEGKGVLQFKLTANGKAAHSSLLWEGENAIDKLIKIYHKITLKYPNKSEDEFMTTVNLSMIEGGDAINKVPAKASMYLDIRHIPSQTKESILKYIKEIDSEVELEIVASGEDYTVNLDNKYVEKYVSTSEAILAQKVKYSKCNSSNDGRFFGKYNIPTIIMNPIGDNYHKDDEYVETESLDKLYDIYVSYIENL